MIKGCERRIIYIRDTGSAVFREAYFILRDGAPSVPQKDMVAEAERIIRERTQLRRPEDKRKGRFDRRNFTVGFLAAVSAVCGGDSHFCARRLRLVRRIYTAFISRTQ